MDFFLGVQLHFTINQNIKVTNRQFIDGIGESAANEKEQYQAQQRYGIHEKTVCGTDEYEKDAHQEKEQRRESSSHFL